MDDSSTTSGATASREFYLPATFQFSHGPGLIERFLGRLVGPRGSEERPTIQTNDSEFYLPATPDVRPAHGR